MTTQNINQSVWKILQSDLAIQKDLNRDIVNIRALAKYIIKKYSLLASLDAVISAIRRFQGQEVFEEEDALLLNAFKDSLISTKNNIACITIPYSSPAIFTKIGKLGEDGKRVRIVIGSHEIKVFCEHQDLDEMKTLFRGPQLKIAPDLTQISVVTREVVQQIKGVAARITSEIALANINIIELLVCQPEFLIYIKEEDTVKAHNSLLKLCSGKGQ